MRRERAKAAVQKFRSCLARLARETQCAIVVVVRRKTAGSAHSVLSSIDGAESARAVHLVCPDPSRPERGLFLPVKNKYGCLATGLAFEFRDVNLGNEISTRVVQFEAEPVQVTAEEAQQVLGMAAEARSALEEAIRFLVGVLRDGPRASKEIQLLAAAEDISRMTLRRARVKLGVQISKGFWSLPKRKEGR